MFKYAKFLLAVPFLVLFFSFVPQADGLTTNVAFTSLASSSTQYWSVADASQTGLDLAGDFTLTAWINFATLPTPLGNEEDIMSKWDTNGAATTNRSYSFFIYQPNASPGTYNMGVWTSNGSATEKISVVPWSPSPVVGTWYHVAAVHSGTTILFYVNGVQMSTTQTGQNSTILNSGQPFYIGRTTNTAVILGKFDGKIDDARVWSRALSGSEVSAVASKPCTAPNGANIISDWLFDNNGNDSVGVNNLTNNNSATFSSVNLPYTCANFNFWQFNEF